MSRDLESLALELEYWQHLLADMQELVNLPGDAAGELAACAVSLASLAPACRTIGEQHTLEESLANVTAALEVLKRIMAAAGRVGDLAGGRAKALAPEVAAAREDAVL
jgi:hypothetical protein